MELTKRNAKIVKDAIQTWKDCKIIDKEIAESLILTIKVIAFDWYKLAKYSIFVALICFFIAIATLLSDPILMHILRNIFNSPAIAKFLFMTALAGYFFYFGIKRKKRFMYKVYSNEAILTLGVASTAIAIYQLGKVLKLQFEQFRHLSFYACLIYGLIGYYFKSTLIWIFALISLGIWYGAETGYLSGWGSYYLGMNYSLRFVLFGSVLTAAAIGVEQQSWARELQRSTLTMGLLYLFIALWILSIFGDYDSMYAWNQAKPIELFHWSILFAAVAIGAIIHGLRCDNDLTKGFGITFLFINLYTRFFEYFWTPMHKAVFFAVLATSFWYIGTRAEKIWHFGQRRKQ